MKYWLFDGKDAQGPYEEEDLRRQPGFSPESLICPDGTMSADQWKPSSSYLAARPVEAARPPMEPARPPMEAARPPMEAARPPMEKTRPPMAEPAKTIVEPPAAKAPVVTGESPEAIRLRKALELPARRKDPEPDVIPAPPPPAPGMSPALKALAALSAAAALAALGWFGLKGRKAAAPELAMPAASPAPAAPAAPAAAASAVAAAPQPAAAAPAAASDQSQAAVEFARDFPLQSRSRARPADVLDVFVPKRWKPAATLQELYEQRALEWLAKESLATLERQGHGLAEGDSEVRRSPDLWKQHAQRFLAGAQTAWSAAPEAGIWKVSATLGGRPSEPKREFLVDLAARTIKPVGQAAWFDLDPKQAAKWGDRYLRLSEEPDDSVAGPQTPVYAMKGAKPAAPAAAPVAAKKAPAAAAAAPDEDEYDDPVEKAVAEDKPDPEIADDIPESARIKTFAALKPAPKPAPRPKPAAKPAPAPAPAPEPAPEPAAAKDEPPHKSVADMSVDELQKYLSRDKK